MVFMAPVSINSLKIIWDVTKNYMENKGIFMSQIQHATATPSNS